MMNYTHFQPYDGAKSYSLRWLKPIRALLVKAEEQSFDFIACTSAGVNFFAHQLITQPVEFSCTIVGFDGHTLCHSQGTSKQTIIAIEQSDQLKEMLTFMALLNGAIKDPHQLKQMVENYQWTHTLFGHLVSAINQLSVTRATLSTDHLSAFEQLCGWRKTASTMKLSEHKHRLLNHQQPVSLPLRQARPLEGKPTRSDDRKLLLKPKSALTPSLFWKEPSQQLNFDILENNLQIDI